MTSGPYVHQVTRRVVMAEVDASHIHFTTYYRWMDRGLSELLAALGHPFRELLETGPGIPLVDSTCRFVARVVIDDEIDCRTWIGAVGTTSFRTRHRFVRGGELVAAGELVHVCVDRPSRRPVPVPQWLRDAVVDEPL